MITSVKVGRAKKQEYQGIIYDSKEEIYFLWWVHELMAAGYIAEYIYQPDSITITTPVKSDYKSATGLPRKNSIFPGHVYTPDFLITWKDLIFCHKLSIKGKAIYPIRCDNKMVSLVEVKAAYTDSNILKNLNIKRAVIYANTGQYISLVKIDNKRKSLFDKTFTPARYLKTDKGAMDRKIHYDVRLVSEGGELGLRV